MRLRQLRFLVAVMEEGSFTAAANRLHATQSGISAQIKLLEESLGAKLFERSVAGVVPTAAGKLAYERASVILRETASMMSDVGGLENEASGKVSAGLMPTIARSVAAPVLETFANAHPNIEIKIEEAYSAHLSEGVTSGRLDFAIVPPSNPVAGLHTSRLESDVEVFVSGPDPTREHLSAVDLTSIEPLKLVLPGPENIRRTVIDERIRTFGIPVKKIMELDAVMATLDLVARSDWTTILPGCLVVSDIASNERSLHPIIKPAMSLQYVLIETASKTLSPAAQLLSVALQKELSAVCARSRGEFGVEG